MRRIGRHHDNILEEEYWLMRTVLYPCRRSGDASDGKLRCLGAGLGGRPAVAQTHLGVKVQRGSTSTLTAFIEIQEIKVYCIEKVSHQYANFSSFKVNISNISTGYIKKM